MLIKVVSIISRMNVGGPAVLLSNFIKNLPSSEISHTLITGKCLSNEIDFLEQNPLDSQVIYIDDIKRSILPLADFRSFIQLMKVLRSLKPDIVHTHTSKAGVLGRLATRITLPGTKIIHTYHGHLLYGYFSTTKIKLIVWLEKFLASLSDKLIAVTNQVRVDLISSGIGVEKQWGVIHPGVVESASLDKQLARSNFLIPTEKFIVAWIGRFTDIKNPMLAINNMAQLPKNNQIELIMAGSGEQWEECKKYSQARNLPVSFLGWTSEVNQLLEAADLLLMTSKNEGMPRLDRDLLRLSH